MRVALALFLLLPIPAVSQDQAAQRELIGRQQQFDAFVLQLRQSQEILKVRAGARPETETRHLAERQRLESVSAEQLRDVRTDTPQELRPYERQKADEERRPLITPQYLVPADGIEPPTN